MGDGQLYVARCVCMCIHACVYGDLTAVSFFSVFVCVHVYKCVCVYGYLTVTVFFCFFSENASTAVEVGESII